MTSPFQFEIVTAETASEILSAAPPRSSADSDEALPDGWTRVRLSDVATHYGGLTGKSGPDFGDPADLARPKPYVPYKTIFDDRVIDPSRYSYVDVAEGERQHRVRANDILVTGSSEIPAEVGTTAIVHDDRDDLFLNSFCFGVRIVDEDQLHPEFASYMLRADHVRRKIIRLAQGSTRFNLSKLAFMKLELEVPEDVRVQHQIADALQTWDHAINRLEALTEALGRQQRGAMQRLLTGRLPALPEGPSS